MKNNKPVKDTSNRKLTRIIVGFMQILVMSAVLFSLIGAGLVLFRLPLLERYFEKKTGYHCSIEEFELHWSRPSVELKHIIIYNDELFSDSDPILAEINKLCVALTFKKIIYFPKQLEVFDLDINKLSLIRIDGNQFNVGHFIRALRRAWIKEGKNRNPLYIENGSIKIFSLIAYDQERDNQETLNVDISYEGMHKHVTRFKSLFDPLIEHVKEEVDRYYFFKYLSDQIKGVFKDDDS